MRLLLLLIGFALIPGRIDAQPPPARPRLLVPLYAGYVAVTVGDLATTHSATQRGAREANYLRRALGPEQWKGIVLQGTSAAFGIWAIDKARRLGHPKAAVVTMVIVDTVGAMIVVQNQYAGRR